MIDISKEHLKIVKNPKHGYGKGINPCLDCHILMLKKAKGITKKEKFDFVATGEVLGERPMSQNRAALKLIEEESSLKGVLLRPLSAKLLPETTPEKNGWVRREGLFAISGRSRRQQITLAKRWKIKYYPTPAGGCLLTDPEFSKRLRELLNRCPECRGNDIELLKLGRHFWKDKVKIVVGRDHQENLRMKKISRRGDILVELKDYPGPTTLIRNYTPRTKILPAVIERAKELTQHYSKKARSKKGMEFKIFEVGKG